MASETKADASIGAQNVAMPESKADLLTSANEAAGLVQKVFFTYLLVSLYLAVLIGSTTHEQMLRESGVQLPLFGVGLSVFWVYAIAPWLYLALHVNLLVQHYLLSRKLHAFNRALKPLSKEESDDWRVRLYPSMFAQMLAGAENRNFKRFVLHSIVFLTVAVAPIVLLLWMQIRFLPYHSEAVTWGHRLALFASLALLWYYWPLMTSDEDASWREIVTHERPILHSSVCAILSIAVLLASTLVAVVPGGLAERITFATTADSRPPAAACESAEVRVAERIDEDRSQDEGASGNLWQRTLASLRGQIPRHLDVREIDLLAEEPAPELIAALMMDGIGEDEDKDAAETLRARTVGLMLERRDLRGANFRHADLTKADLERAKLDGADLGCAKLTGAILSKAELRDANLTGAFLQEAKLLGSTGLEKAILTNAVLESAKLNGAFVPGGGLLGQTKGLGEAILEEARLIGADLENVEMADARLKGAKLQGAQLKGAILRGANLKEADLRGANLEGVNLQGADLSLAQLQGAYLRGATVGGANFKRADLSSADLRDVKAETGEFEAARGASEKLGAEGDAPVDLSGAVGRSVRCGSSLQQAKIGDIECLKEGNTVEYRQDLVAALAPLICSQDKGLFDAEASVLRTALLKRASEEDKTPTSDTSSMEKDAEPADEPADTHENVGGGLVGRLKAVKEPGGGLEPALGDDAPSTVSLLTKAISGPNCRGANLAQ